MPITCSLTLSLRIRNQFTITVLELQPPTTVGIPKHDCASSQTAATSRTAGVPLSVHDHRCSLWPQSNPVFQITAAVHAVAQAGPPLYYAAKPSSKLITAPQLPSPSSLLHKFDSHAGDPIFISATAQAAGFSTVDEPITEPLDPSTPAISSPMLCRISSPAPSHLHNLPCSISCSELNQRRNRE